MFDKAPIKWEYSVQNITDGWCYCFLPTGIPAADVLLSDGEASCLNSSSSRSGYTSPGVPECSSCWQFAKSWNWALPRDVAAPISHRACLYWHSPSSTSWFAMRRRNRRWASLRRDSGTNGERFDRIECGYKRRLAPGFPHSSRHFDRPSVCTSLQFLFCSFRFFFSVWFEARAFGHRSRSIQWLLGSLPGLDKPVSWAGRDNGIAKGRLWTQAWGGRWPVDTASLDKAHKEKWSDIPNCGAWGCSLGNGTNNIIFHRDSHRHLNPEVMNHKFHSTNVRAVSPWVYQSDFQLFALTRHVSPMNNNLNSRKKAKH